jgi:methylphosphotriester-DNA--protein-cysteine methyltransferase
LGDELVLFTEVFWSENFVGLPRFQQEAAARNPGLGNCRRCHLRSPSQQTAKSRRDVAEIASAILYARTKGKEETKVQRMRRHWRTVANIRPVSKARY